jgi:Na+-transporting methylmalonyl-CoA/oxaloacetate decarboxylase gamma subunit
LNFERRKVMKIFRKISTFLAIVLLISCVFAFSAVAEDDIPADTQSETVGEVIITEKDYVWNVKCPSCGKNDGLKYSENSFICTNNECKTEFEFTSYCSACGKAEFVQTEEGFYKCNNEKCIGNPITLDDLLGKLTVVEKEPETQDSGKLDMDEKPESFGERVEIALQGTATGMIMIFAVLGLLAVIVSLSKLICYDIPNKKKERARAAHTPATAPSAPVETVQEAPAISEPVTDDGELAAVITAAIAAMIESGEYKNEFIGGFRVVSFKRSTNSAWNRK